MFCHFSYKCNNVIFYLVEYEYSSKYLCILMLPDPPFSVLKMAIEKLFMALLKIFNWFFHAAFIYFFHINLSIHSTLKAITSQNSLYIRRYSIGIPLSHWERNIFELIKIHRLDKNVLELLIIEYENLCCFVKSVLTKAEYNRCLNWFFLQNFKHNSRFKIDGLLKKCWVDCIITSLVVSDMIYRWLE